LKTTKKNVIIETTNMVHGCLEQGGVSGRVVAYPIAQVEKLLGVAPAKVDENYEVPGYRHVSARELVERFISGSVIKKGTAIQ